MQKILVDIGGERKIVSLTQLQDLARKKYVDEDALVNVKGVPCRVGDVVAQLEEDGAENFTPPDPADSAQNPSPKPPQSTLDFDPEKDRLLNDAIEKLPRPLTHALPKNKSVRNRRPAPIPVHYVPYIKAAIVFAIMLFGVVFVALWRPNDPGEPQLDALSYEAPDREDWEHEEGTQPSQDGEKSHMEDWLDSYEASLEDRDEDLAAEPEDSALDDDPDPNGEPSRADDESRAEDWLDSYEDYPENRNKSHMEDWLDSYVASLEDRDEDLAAEPEDSALDDDPDPNGEPSRADDESRAEDWLDSYEDYPENRNKSLAAGPEVSIFSNDQEPTEDAEPFPAQEASQPKPLESFFEWANAPKKPEKELEKNVKTVPKPTVDHDAIAELFADVPANSRVVYVGSTRQLAETLAAYEGQVQTIVLESGSYELKGSIAVNGKLTLKSKSGDYAYTTILVAAEPAARAAFEISGGRLTLEGVTLKRAGSCPDEYALVAVDKGSAVANNCVLDGSADKGGRGLLLNGAGASANLKSSVFRGFNDGVYAFNWSSLTASNGCVFEENGRGATATHGADLNISGSSFIRNEVGVKVDANGSGSLDKCSFEENGFPYKVYQHSESAFKTSNCVGLD